MDLFSLITILAIIFCAYHVGEYLALSYGVLGWIIGLVVGGSIPLLIRKGLNLLSIHFLDKCFPSRPPCKNGTCHAQDYETVEYRCEDNSSVLVFRCKCGTKYALSFPYFMELLEDGTPKPYMKKIWGKWKLDKEESEEISKDYL